jgi:hypothetical protein
MERKRYGIKDNDLIWESLMKRTNHKQSSQLDKLLENDLQYIEQFLIREGLMDSVKGAFGKVKDFATQKLLKPVIDMIVGALKKDPNISQQLAGAVDQGPDAVAQLAAAQGDPSVAGQIEGQPDPTAAGAQAESYVYQFNMNELICNALVEERLITSGHSQIIQEKYYRSTINEMHQQLKQGEGCPWMPATALVSENATKAAGDQIAAILKQNTGGRQAKIGAILKHTTAAFPAFQKFVDSQAVQQAAAAEPEAAGAEAGVAPGPEAAGAEAGVAPGPEAAGAEAGVAPGPEAAGAEAGVAPGPEAAGAEAGAGGEVAPPPADATQGGQGILGKIWGFLKNNKGILTGAVALGVLGLMMTNPATAAIALPALKTGLAGAGMGFVKGAAGTQGGVKDRLMGGLNQAGKTGAMAAGAGALAGAAGAAFGGDGASAGGEPAVDPQSEPPQDANATATSEFTPPEVPEEPAVPEEPGEQEGPMPYDQNQQDTLLQRSGEEQYNRDSFMKSLSPREKMNLRPGSRGFQTAYNQWKAAGNAFNSGG